VDVRQQLLPALRAGDLYNCGIVRAEVLRGMKNPRLKADMEAFFDITPEVPTDAKLWRQVSDLGWELGRSGKWPPVTDLAIAACALRIRATLISPDAHFEDIPGLSLKTELPNL
jgi:predicted nucleic acid-binding protein